jgi:FKBP-type peptidyl-prolyl cis-trans isomerase
MKKSMVLALCALLVAPLMAEDLPAAASGNVDLSYSLGMLMGASLKSSGLTISPEAFTAGIKDVLDGKDTKYSNADAQAAVQAALQDAQTKKLALNLANGQAFLSSNLKKQGIVATASGLQYEVLTKGTGPMPAISDTVKVNYEGKFLDGQIFDSSYARNEPAVFPLTGVIAGWTEGVQLMPVGSKYRFFVPSELAYGDQGAGGVIEPNTVLVFEIELLSIEAPEATEAAPVPTPAQ